MLEQSPTQHLANSGSLLQYISIRPALIRNPQCAKVLCAREREKHILFYGRKAMPHTHSNDTTL